MRQAVQDVWAEFNTPLEGRLNFMYLDTRGLVTTGLGNLLDATKADSLRAPTDNERSASHAIARELPWEHEDGTPASAEEVDAEWDQIKARTDQASAGGGTFKAFATLFLPDSEIDRLVNTKLSQMETALRKRDPFSGFDNYPADAQLGLLSMAWAMGPLFSFPKFQSFVAAGDWRGASTECRFQPDVGTITIRNDRDQQLFSNAAAVVEQGLDPDQLIWPGTS